MNQNQNAAQQIAAAIEVLEQFYRELHAQIDHVERTGNLEYAEVLAVQRNGVSLAIGRLLDHQREAQ